MIQLRELFALILVVVVLALACAPSRSQSNITGAFYNKPAELKLEPSIKKELHDFKSPFEPRIAVTLIEVYRGWEGPPYTGHIKIVGASLEAGFK